VIDTTIVQEGKSYYRFSKDEQYKAITMEVSSDLMGPWKDVGGFSLSRMTGYEGPECYRLSGSGWCLILDHYSQGKGYQPFVSSDLAGGQFAPGEGFSLPFRLRHGSVLPLSSAEYERLVKAFGN
jgi:arabinoxylan arabinofuranohydrolase